MRHHSFDVKYPVICICIYFESQQLIKQLFEYVQSYNDLINEINFILYLICNQSYTHVAN